MCMMNWACIPKQTSCNHCLSSLSATQVTTLWLKQPTCFCSVGKVVTMHNHAHVFNHVFNLVSPATSLKLNKNVQCTSILNQASSASIDGTKIEISLFISE